MRTQWAKSLRSWQPQELGAAGAIVALAVAITIVNPQFSTLENAFDLAANYAFLGILAVGLLVVLVSGGIDISFVAVAAVAQYVTAIAIRHGAGNLGVALLLAASVGTALGLANALLVHYLRAASIVVTIATMNVYYGLLMFFSGGRWIHTLPGWFREIGAWKLIRLERPDGTEYGLPLTAVIFLSVVALTAVLLKFTILGRKIYALGGSRVAAERAGFNVLVLNLCVYGYMGLLAGIAGLVHLLDVPTAAPNALWGRELAVFAAVVLGGASLAGGVGSIRGTVLGITLVAVLSSGVTLVRIRSEWYEVVMGLVILVSVTATAYRVRRTAAATDLAARYGVRDAG